MMSKRFLLTILLMAAIVLAACGGGGAPNRGDVIVYVAVPLSGFQANGGQTILGGVRLAAAELNNASAGCSAIASWCARSTTSRTATWL